jgi:hypothetical protein
MRHLEENNETYFTHLRFAGTMGLHLLVRGVVFILHGLLPCVKLPTFLSLGATHDLVRLWSEKAKNRQNNNKN